MNELVEIEPLNLKALYLRGKAFYHLQDLVRAYRDFARALEIDPGNSIIASYISQLQAQHPDLESQSGQAMELNRANSFPNGISSSEPGIPLDSRLHLQSMGSTNVNSGSERSQETKESMNDFKARLSPKAKATAHKLKKEASILHPSSPSKIQIDSIDVRCV
jgi:tetratricopeptide (TPR) repeat protein